MTKSICKRLSFVLSIVLCMACFTLTAFASSPSETTDSYEKEIFEHFVDDYLLITGVDEKEATEIFNTVVNNRSLPQKDIESLVYGAEKNERYEDTVLYIQENYDKIVSVQDNYLKDQITRYVVSWKPYQCDAEELLQPSVLTEYYELKDYCDHYMECYYYTYALWERK